MFDYSNAFGQSSNSAFGSPSVFGQTNNAFGTQASSPIGASTVFAPLYAPAYRNSRSSFGASSRRAIGASSSSFGGLSSSIFGQYLGSTTPPSNSFGSSYQQSPPAFGNNVNGWSPFGVRWGPPFGNAGSSFDSSPNNPAFGATADPFIVWSTPAFGGQSTSAFGSSSSSPFGSQATTPAFGGPGFGQHSFGCQHRGSRVTPYSQTTEADSGSGAHAAGKLDSISAMPAYKEKSHEELRWEDYQLGDNKGSSVFEQKPAFGGGFRSTTSSSPFGSPFQHSQPAFGNSVFGPSPFGATSQPNSVFGPSPFGSSTQPAFGGPPSTPTFTFPTPPAFGPTNTPAFGFTTTPAFPSTNTPAFSSHGFGLSYFGGSRVTHYEKPPVSVSAMTTFKDKSHEELRWEDYQLGDKGGPNPAGQSFVGMGFNTINTQAANPFSFTTSTNPFGGNTISLSTPSTSMGFNQTPTIMFTISGVSSLNISFT